MAFAFSKLTSLFKTDVLSREDTGVVGVDVGSSAIKIVQLHTSKGVATLDTYGELQLGPYENVEIGRTTHLRVDKLTEAFVDILREASATAHNIAVAISYNSSFVTIITVPTADTEKIAAMIPVEARKYVPVPLNDVVLDWFPVSARSPQKTTKILLAAIHNDAVNKYDAMIRGADLVNTCSEIEMFSSIRSVVSQEDDTVAVIDFGGGSTKLYLVQKGVVGKTHSVQMSGTELTLALSKALGMDFRQAEELKRTSGLHGIPNDDRAQKALVAVLERGLREIHKVILRYEEEEEQSVKKIIVSGGASLLLGLPAYAQDMLSRPVEIADPFSKVAYPAFLEDTLKEAGPAFAVAVGAALRGLISQ